MTTKAEYARFFLRRARKMAPATVHAICNEYLKSLRSGSRRRSHSVLRWHLRALRERAASQLKAAPR
jgi:hypothetical protein